MINLLSPVSTIMTHNPVTISPNENLDVALNIFHTYHIHHIPVELEGSLVGIISKTDISFFNKMIDKEILLKLKELKIKDFMTVGVARLEPDDRINVAIDIFKMNKFSALPVLEGKTIVGIVTTFDIINILDSNSAELSHYNK
jgi:acetoin utilization protein AcuB